MAANAKLLIVLKADEKIVAQSEDSALWHQVLGIIHGVSGTKSPDFQNSNVSIDSEHQNDSGGSVSDAGRFAKSIGVSEVEVLGALSPTKESPYLQLAPHNWEAFKKNTPKRGIGAVSPIGFAGTALALWIKEAKIDVPATQISAIEVLNSIGAKDPNPSRGIKNTKWLLPRPGGTILVNPAEISRAQKLVRAFCLKKPLDIE